jgi:NAD(P)-dependent dehydrogenase (short-subunit alcohol dehydrogenase family)
MSFKYSSKLHGKRVLVLGGTSGIGFCVAEACIDYGATVIVSSSQQSKVDNTVSRLTASYPDSSGRVLGHACDLSDSEKLETNLTTLLDFATDKGVHKLNAIVNTAGAGPGPFPLAAATPEKLNRPSVISLYAPSMLAKLIAVSPGHYMPVSPESSITLTGGVAGHRPPPGWSMYVGWTVAKEGLMRGLAVDLKPIRVNLVAPGPVKTELMDKLSGGSAEKTENLLKLYESYTLTGLLGMPEDIAECYLWLIKDHGVTGTIATSDSGCTLK